MYLYKIIYVVNTCTNNLAIALINIMLQLNLTMSRISLLLPKAKAKPRLTCKNTNILQVGGV